MDETNVELKPKRIHQVYQVILLCLFPHPGLQMTDVELDARVTALEEHGGGGGGNQNGKNVKFIRIHLFNDVKNIYITMFSVATPVPATIAFHTVMTSYDTISEGSTLLFNEILVNEGDG